AFLGREVFPRSIRPNWRREAGVAPLGAPLNLSGGVALAPQPPAPIPRRTRATPYRSTVLPASASVGGRAAGRMALCDRGCLRSYDIQAVVCLCSRFS